LFRTVPQACCPLPRRLYKFHQPRPSSTLKMETAGFSEVLVTIYQTTRRHISDGSHLYSGLFGGAVSWALRV
jgi:hypothetical protein